MGDPPSKFTIERIDNNGNYCPGNCRWASRKEQANNKENSHIETYNEESLTISQWSEKTGMSKSVIINRLNRGWTFEKTITTPVKPFHKKIEYKGKIQTVKEWSKELGFPDYIIRNRLNCCKWSVEKTFETPYNG
jgi:hypothetical protein